MQGMKICSCFVEKCTYGVEFWQKSVQFFALTFRRKSVIINDKFIFPAMKKRSIFGSSSESRRLVRGGEQKERRALWSSEHKSGLVQYQPMRVEPRKINVAFVPCFAASDEGFFSSLAKYIVGVQLNVWLVWQSPFGESVAVCPRKTQFCGK